MQSKRSEIAMASEIDISSYFEKHSIVEVQQILSKTRNDIERKKEDLRVMVGERYRDLIEAADTISDMQKSAEAITNNIHTMEGLCESLQERGLIGFKTRLSQTEIDPTRNFEFCQQYSFAIQVKLLVDTPEVLWGLTDKGEFLAAAELLLLAQYTHTSIQLSPKANQILSHFPVVSCQWSNIQQFKSTIVKGCTQVIKSNIGDHEAVIDAIGAVLLIEGISMGEALGKVLALRAATLSNILIPKPSSMAKQQLVEYAVLILSTFELVSKTFISKDGENCVLEKKLHLIAEGGIEDIRYPVDLLQESSLAMGFLPKSLQQFRPKLRSNIQTLEKKIIQEKLSVWLKTLIEASTEAIQKLLECITSVKALTMIRSEVNIIQQTKFSEEYWQQVNCLFPEGENFNPWDAVIRHKIIQKAEHLIKKELDHIRKHLLQMANELVEDITKLPKVCSEEGDITYFIWSESSSDLPEQIGWMSATMRASSSASNNTGLFCKTMGYTKRIQIICKNLNGRLGSLLQDIFHYNDADAIKERLLESLNLEDDYVRILNWLQEQTASCFKSCLRDIEKIAQNSSDTKEVTCNLEEKKPFKPSPAIAVLISLSRLCHAIPVLCDRLRLCGAASLLANQETARRLHHGVLIESAPWNDLKNTFAESNNRLLNLYLKYLCERLKTNLTAEFSSILQSNNSENSLLIFPSWEKLTIEEEAETGTVVKSDIFIPPHPSPVLTQALMKLCSAINCLSIHTVSRSCLSELNYQLSLSLLSIYEKLSDRFQLLNQTTALQLLFDIKFIQTVIVSREQREISSKFTSLWQQLECQIDPFDFDVFLPHINSRVKANSQRFQVLLGALVPKDKQLLPRTTPTPTSGGNNIMLVVPSVEIPRFSNVPLPAPKARPTFSLGDDFDLEDSNTFLQPLDIKTERTESQTTSLSESSVLAASRSAASLFSVMSSSWFGGSS